MVGPLKGGVELLQPTISVIVTSGTPAPLRSTTRLWVGVWDRAGMVTLNKRAKTNTGFFMLNTPLMKAWDRASVNQRLIWRRNQVGRFQRIVRGRGIAIT